MTAYTVRRTMVAAAFACALAPLAAVPAGAAGSKGATTMTKVGCTAPGPYEEFEKVYAEDGRVAAYKVLAQSEKCEILEQETEVELQEAVADFDFGWGTGTVWRVTPTDAAAKAPDALYIRLRAGDE